MARKVGVGEKSPHPKYNQQMSELLFALAEVIKRRDFPLWFSIAARIYLDDPSIGLEYVRGFRREMVQIIHYSASPKERAEANLYLRKTYILTAPDGFEDFMIAMEWDRAPKARFWMPRRSVLEGRFRVATSIQHFIDDPAAKFLAVSCPPGTGKSTLIKFLLAYIAGKYPDSCNMYISYAKGMTDMMYASVLSMLTDSEYNFKEIFPNVPTLSASAEYSTLSYRPSGTPPTLGLVAMGGSVTGRTRANKFFITDDLVKNDEVARSPERLQTLYSDYTNTLTTRKIGDEVKEIMLGTIWSIHDPISQKKAKYEGRDGYYFLALPVCDEQGHSNFVYDHPDRYTDEMVKQLKRDLQPAIFSALYMQKGVEKEGMAFGWDKLIRFNGVLPDGEPDNIFFCADVAWGGGDYFSMPVCYQFGSDIYIPDVIYDTGDKSKTKPRVVGKILQHKCRMGRFEANNGGAEYCDDIGRILKDDHGYTCLLTSKKAPSTMGKLTKIEQHQDTIRKFYFLSDAAMSGNIEYTRFMNDLTTFSFTSKNLHDDAPDSLAQVADFVEGRGVRAKVEIGQRFF